MRLQSFEGVIKPSQSQTNIIHELDVPSGVSKLLVLFKYSPKEVEEKEALNILKCTLETYGEEYEKPEDFLPVKNLVTLSFDDPKGYRGACHRQPNEQIITIGEDSTPGIENREVIEGKWQVMLNLHYVGSNVSYSIDIEGVEV